MHEGSWHVPGLGARHEATLVAKLVPGGLSDPLVFSRTRRQLLAAFGPRNCASQLCRASCVKAEAQTIDSAGAAPAQ